MNDIFISSEGDHLLSIDEEAASVLNDLCDRISHLTDESSSDAPVFEYSWPESSDESFVVEDLFALYLKLTLSQFRLKFPNNVSRCITLDELSYIETLKPGISCSIDTKVIRSVDALNLLDQFFPEYVNDYKKTVSRNNSKLCSGKKTEIVCTKTDARRSQEIRKKAMKSASEWNMDMNRIRKTERPSFYEHQTMLIHYPHRRSKASCNTSLGAFPAALIPGQFQHYYKHYTTAEMFRIPMNTVLDVEPYRPVHRGQSPEPISVVETDLLTETNDLARSNPIEKLANKECRRNSRSSTSFSMDQSSLEKPDLNESCAFCCEELKSTDKFVRCTKCRSCGHTTCMDMPDDMFNVVKSYAWMCMECKPCSICSKLDSEDQMLFCDRCDRGYHTFCVGLEHLPDGHWVCPKFCSNGVAQPDASPSSLEAQSITSSVVYDVSPAATVRSAVVASVKRRRCRDDKADDQHIFTPRCKRTSSTMRLDFVNAI